MKQTINFSDFCDAFRAHDRDGKFSYTAKRVIFDWIEEYEEITGAEQDLDVIAICCDFAEETTEGIIKANGLEDDVEGMDEDEQHDFVQEYLEDNTTLLGETPSGFVYTNF